jgi:outer membrane protein assembly factor BamD (BamD/ComL family)
MQFKERSFMKRFTALSVGLLAIAIPLAGCSKKSSVDTSNLESSFESAEPAVQSDINQAVSSIKDGNYSEAMAQLQSVAKKAQLTPEQQQAIKDTIASIQKLMAEMANKAAGDLQKSLPK